MNRLPLAFRGILVAFVALSAIYAAATPLFEKPDENWHFAAAMYMLETGALPQNTPAPPDHYARQEANQPPLYYMTLASVWRILGFDALTEGYLVLAKDNEQIRLTSFLTESDNRRLYVQGRCAGNCQSARMAAYIGRGLSVFYVGASLIVSALTVRLIFPQEDGLLLLTTALMAFNPQMLHIGSSVSNDSLTILLMSVGFYLAAGWLKGVRTPRFVLLMGLVAGAGLLTKLSAATLGLVFGVLLLATSARRWRDLARFGAVSLTVCGWWLIFNTITYGDPSALNAHMSVAPQPGAPQTANELLFHSEAVVRSFWAEFGWGQITLPEALNTLMIAVILLSFGTGGLVFVGRWRKLTEPQRSFLLFGMGVFLVVFGLLLRWMTTTTAPHGRLLFPAILPISLFMAAGLSGWIPVRWRLPATYALSAGLFAVALWMPFAFIRPAYTVPEPIVTPQPGVAQAMFHESNGGAVSVRDVALTQTPARLYVQISWQIEAPMNEDYLVFIHALNADGEIIAQRDTYPGLANRPFTRLKAGEIVHDVYPLAYPALAEIQAIRIGLYKLGDQPNTWIRLDAESAILPIRDNAVTISLDGVRIFSS